MVEIQRTGSVMKVGADGCLVNETSKENIVGKWKEVVAGAVEACKRHLGDKLHSVYLRGSVARGKAIDGVSDVDIIVVLSIGPRELGMLDLDWTKREEDILRENYPFQTRVEFRFLSRDEVPFTDRFIIQTQSVCIYGNDLSQSFGKIEFSRPNILKLIEENKIDTKIEDARLITEQSDDPETIAAMVSWIAKRFLRMGVLLAALKEPKYTRDLYPSYELFADQYPEKTDDMRQALEYAINPPEDKQEALRFMNDLGSWLVGEKQQRLIA